MRARRDDREVVDTQPHGMTQSIHDVGEVVLQHHYLPQTNLWREVRVTPKLTEMVCHHWEGDKRKFS